MHCVLPRQVHSQLRKLYRLWQLSKQTGFSAEESTIHKYVSQICPAHKFFVDIAAQDGVGGSQTLRLAKLGWTGLAVECDDDFFSQLSRHYRRLGSVALFKTRVSPNNVNLLLSASGCPFDFGFLSLDIDSFDYYVLDQILERFRPSLICTEINEIIPPPIAFTVTYSEKHSWGGDYFQGQSITKCYELCIKHRYKIVELSYNNLFLVPDESEVGPALPPEVAYFEGYVNKMDRRQRFPWNERVDVLLSMNSIDALRFLQEEFARYAGLFTLELSGSNNRGYKEDKACYGETTNSKTDV